MIKEINMEKSNDRKLHNPTIRVIRIFEALNNSSSGLTLSELAKETDCPKSTISPIIYTLLSKNYIYKDKNTSKYNIGIKSFLIGSSYSSNCNSIDIVKKEMEDIVSSCNEVCQLGVLIDYNVFYLAKVDPEQPIKLLSYVGAQFPAYATAHGKALLSGCSNEDIEHTYKNGLKPFTKKTITDVNELLKQIEEIRKGGLAYEFEEINQYTGCFALPLRKNNKVVAAISISFPLFRASKEKLNLIENILYKKRIIIEQLINELDLKF